MKNMRLLVVLKEKLRTTYFFTMSLTMLFALSLFSQNILAETNTIPRKGMTQDQVKANFGDPLGIKAAVGSPPISRWDYQDHSVYFEGKYVIHSFYHNQRSQTQLNPQPSANQAPNNQQVETVQATTHTETPLENQAANETTAEALDLPSEEAIVEEIPQQLDKALTEEIEAKQIEEAAVEETKSDQSVSEETKSAEETKDLNFEEAEKSADYSKWGY